MHIRMIPLHDKASKVASCSPLSAGEQLTNNIFNEIPAYWPTPFVFIDIPDSFQDVSVSTFVFNDISAFW
jgi:hypothetical protein